MNPQIALFGYGLAGVAFATLYVLSISVWRKRLRGSLLPVACLAAALWGVLLVYTGTRTATSGLIILAIEVSHDLAWLWFLASLFGGAVAKGSNRLIRWGGVWLAAALIAVGIAVELTQSPAAAGALQGQLIILGSIATALFALVVIEQIYRNSRPAQRNAIKFLCVGLAGIFAFDLVLYSDAVVSGRIGEVLWGGRGYVAAICVPIIAASIRRVGDWGRGIFVSRQVVFYTTTMVVAGIYLSIIGVVGYFIQRVGKDWGPTLQLLFFAAAALAFVVFLMSEQIRGRARVFLAKHFFERKYDYRAEWLRLINTLTAAGDGMPLKKRAIKALADIVTAKSGHLWLWNGDGTAFEAVAGWNVPSVNGAVDGDDAFCAFLRDTGWVLDLSEVVQEPAKYARLDADSLPAGIAPMNYVVPLLHGGELLGFVTLSHATTPITLNFEDHDLLKTAGLQIASYLAQEEATEQLAEGRQFEAYSRFTAYIMHDLKNAVAQQSLVVENADKHKRNPDFVDDAMQTIKGSVERMKRVLRTLRQRSIDEPSTKVNVAKLVAEAESQCADRSPVPEATICDGTVTVLANEDRLLMAICHAIRNAQDATPGDGHIRIRVQAVDGHCEIEITDTGQGMDEAFVRERLFRPFDSTKGAEGMGIGAYQIRETVRMFHGDVDVASEVGKGTKLRIRLPVVRGEAA